MSRGSTALDNPEYDRFLVAKGRERELRKRHLERVASNKGYKGWHFGLGARPVHTNDKQEFQHELKKRGLMMRDDVGKPLR